MYEPGLVSVVIVNWNRRDLLKSCLESLQKQTYRNFEIIVVDNASQDGSVEFTKNFFPKIKLITNKENLLYTFAQNQGLCQSKGEFILCLNNDVILERNFLQETILAMKTDNKIGIISGKILSKDKIFIDTTGQFLSRYRKPVERGYKQKDSGQFDKGGFVFGAGGVAPLYRREMLEEIKLEDGEYFDNHYGLFYEDLDLNWRANCSGWEAYYTPRAICYHIRGGSAKLREPKISFLKRFDFCYLLPEHQLLLLRNRYATIIKNDSLKNFVQNFLFIFLYDFSLWVYLLLFKPIVVINLFKDLKFIKRAFTKRKIIKVKLNLTNKSNLFVK
jgi:GT2 family glycosyltransferase